MEETQKQEQAKEKKPNFWTRIMDSIDKKLEAKSKSSCGCQSRKDKGGSCC